MTPLPEPTPSAERPADGLLHDQRRARRPNTTASLRRSDSDSVVAGVCGGIAAYVDAPAAVVRILFVVSLIPSIGVTGLGYLLLWWLLPAAPAA